MGGPSNSSTGGGDGGVGPAGMTGTTTVAGKTKRTYGTAEDARKTLERNQFRNRGADKLENQKLIGAPLNLLKGPLKEGTKVNRDFFTDKVLGSKNFRGMSKKDFLNKTEMQQEIIYGDYMSNRQTGRTDAYGNDISRDGRSGESQKSIEQPKTASQMDNSGVKSDLITADKTAPTDVEMTQDEINVANKRGKKTKTVLTSSKGDNSRTTLGKKTLLGG